MQFDQFFHDHHHHKRWKRFDGDPPHHNHFPGHHHGNPNMGFGKAEGKRRFFERGQFKMALLALLAAAPMHGYQLIKAMEEKTGGLYSPSAGSVYPNLQLLEDMNLIASREEEGKKLYSITDQGRAHLDQYAKKHKDHSNHHWHGHDHHWESATKEKRNLRLFMKQWSNVVFPMEEAARMAAHSPDSPFAQQFNQLITQFQKDLSELLASAPSSNANSGEQAPSADPAGPDEDDQA